MPRNRRKLPVLSDEERGPPTPQQQQLDVADLETYSELSDIDSETDVPLVSKKKPRLELEEELTPVGE